MEEKVFKLWINDEIVCNFKIEGSKETVDAFMKEIVTTSCGMFWKMRDDLCQIILNGMEVKMSTVFRDKKGKFVNPPKVEIN